MTKLTDLQAVLLTHAAGRASGSLYALPDSVTAAPARVMTAISQLLRRGLLEERAVTHADGVHRTYEDLRYGAFITAAGLAAIGVDELPAAADPLAAPASPQQAPRSTKTTVVLDLLRRADGVTLPELVRATGWLPHSTRAALTGLRKKGHPIERGTRDGASCYRIAGAA